MRSNMRCDYCGRFMRPEPGASLVFVPHSDISFGEERDRCRTCTEKHGPVTCSPQYVAHLCCGIYK